MRDTIERLGRIKTIVLLTLISIIATNLLAVVAHMILGFEIPASNTPVTILVSSILTPVVATPFVNLLFRVFELEKNNRILAAYDPVTGLMSRRALISQAASFLNFAQRKHSSVSMLFIDLDNFKTINDTHGHLVGDNVLHRVGQYINTVKRESDLIGRYGGDELIALLPDTDKEGTKRFAKKLHMVLAENPITANNEPIVITLSIGATTHDGKASAIDINELIRQSDLALYEAKEKGKNCTSFYVSDTKFEVTSI